jgi:Nucleotidyl transferase AbiEii toxin, Type IV TA system
MLHLETIEPGTLSLLERLMTLRQLNDFSLVGGTALSLKYGHRTSIDLDLFCNNKFEHTPIIEALNREFGDGFSFEGDKSKWGIFCYINKVKVDIVYYPHPLIADIENKDGIRMYADADIIAMKINAILGRGKKKDFWDLSELLQHYSLNKMIEYQKGKFPDQHLLISVPIAITYFDDADNSDAPVSLKGQTWESVKKFIEQKTRKYLRG